MMLSMILACDSEGFIGKDNSLPWPYNKQDMDWFKQHTTDNAVIMGYNTWLSLPKKLPNRTNVVLSRSEDVPTKDGKSPDFTIVQKNNSAHFIHKKLQDIHSRCRAPNMVVIGGKNTYDLLLPFTNKIYLTRFNNSFGGDTRMDMEKLLKDFRRCSNGSIDGAEYSIYSRSSNRIV